VRDRAATQEGLVESGKRLVQEQEVEAAIEREIARLLLVLWGASADESCDG